MCEWGNTVKLEVAGKIVDVDNCIAPMVQMFNDNGYETIASCCGHGKVFGNIALTDGRFIDIHADRASWERKDKRIKELEAALSLTDSMIISGEKHSEKSKKIVSKSLKGNKINNG